MLDQTLITNGPTYLAWRQEWRHIYAHIVHQIRLHKTLRRTKARTMGAKQADGARLLKAISENTTNLSREEEARIARSIARNFWRAWNRHNNEHQVCLEMRRQARDMMEQLEQVKAARPPRKSPIFKSNSTT